jgi:PAS domain S-box-containing protein
MAPYTPVSLKNVPVDYQMIGSRLSNSVIEEKLKWQSGKRIKWLFFNREDKTKKISQTIDFYSLNPKFVKISPLYPFTFQPNLLPTIYPTMNYQHLFDRNPYPCWIYNVETLRFLAVNRAATLKYGYSVAEFLGKTIVDIRQEDDRITLLQRVKKLDANEINNEVWQHQTKSGRIFYVRILSQELSFEGQNARLITAVDIDNKVRTEQRNVEQSRLLHKQKQELELLRDNLRLEKQNLAALINNTTDIIWSVNQELRLVSYNRGYSSYIENWCGKQPRSGDHTAAYATSDAEITEWEGYYKRALNGEDFKVELLIPADQSPIFIDARFHPIKDTDGSVIGVGCNCRDITEYKKHLLQVQEQNRQLREIAWIQSHKVRSPLASILGLLEVFNEEDLSDPDNTGVLEKIKIAANDLDNVIYEVVHNAQGTKTDFN